MKLDLTVIYDDLDCPSEEDDFRQLLRRYGVDLDSKPRGKEEDALTLPPGVEDWELRDIGQLHMIMVRWHEYKSRYMGMLKILTFNRKAIYDDLWARAYMSNTGADKERRLFTDVNLMVREAKSRWLKARTQAEAMDTCVVKQLSKNITALSRMISLRSAEMGVSMREASASGMTDADIRKRAR